MGRKDFYEKLSIEQIIEGITAFIKYGPIKVGSIEANKYNLYKLLYTYFDNVERREK